MEGYSDSEECATPEIIETFQVTALKALSEKSRKRYEFIYDQFMDWIKKKQIKSSFSENVLLTYMHEMSNKIKPSTLWSLYSMLRRTLFINHNVDISRYPKLKGLLKRVSGKYKRQKSKIITEQEVNEFIKRAPDEMFLFAKVALIFGVSGACTKEELLHLAVNDIEDLDSAALIKIENPKNKSSRRFTITGIFYGMYKKYASLRPETTEKRFFLNYHNGKCTRQVVGVHKMGAVAKTVASFLHLDNPELYTDHSFRRSPATIPVGGRDITMLKSHEVFEFIDIKCEKE